MSVLIVDNFKGSLTRQNYGNINSGLAQFLTTYGNDPFSNPGNLTWNETATQIDSGATVITDLIVAGKERVESGLSYLYAIGHTGRVYKIQINTTSNPNYDTPVLLATISSQSPTFTRGGFIDFYGATERIYIGHDIGVTRLDFDGTNETFIGSAGSYTANVPRPLKQFVGNLYFGNGNNIGEISVGAVVNTYSKLSPAFPNNTQVRDLDVATNGTYLKAVVSRLALPSILAVTQDTTLVSNAESYTFRWNGTDVGYTSFDTFPSFSMTANMTFGNYEYNFGYDVAGACVFNPTQKILSPILSQSPMSNAVDTNGNILGWMTSEFYNGFTRVSNYIYGALDNEVKLGWYRQFAQPAQGSHTDVLTVPFQKLVSNFGIGASTNGYGGGVFGRGKLYFSTLEYTATGPSTGYKLYKWNPVSASTGTFGTSVYETQAQMFSKKQTIKQVRIYGNPWVTNNSFKIDLIGSGATVITNSSLTFTAGTNLTVGNDFAWYNPFTAPTYAVGLRITNLGTANNVINKVEIDYEPAGI